jgi:hypothetical protein
VGGAQNADIGGIGPSHDRDAGPVQSRDGELGVCQRTGAAQLPALAEVLVPVVRDETARTVVVGDAAAGELAGHRAQRHQRRDDEDAGRLDRLDDFAGRRLVHKRVHEAVDPSPYRGQRVLHARRVRDGQQPVPVCLGGDDPRHFLGQRR